MEIELKHFGGFAARYGGEEFGVILPNTKLEEALCIAEGIRSSVESSKIPHAKSKVSPFVTVSLGVAAVHPTIFFEPDTLISSADKALYQAKEQGRNRVEADGGILL